LLPLAVLPAIYAKIKKEPGARYPYAVFLKGREGSWRITGSRNLVILRVISLALIIFALTRPQAVLEDSRIDTEGIDIVLAVDCSTSMRAQDFTIAGKRFDRLEVIKKVIEDFIKSRQGDRVGIVAFSARAYTVCPLTTDYGWLLDNLARIKTGMIEDGTAIGLGIATSLNRLKNTKAKSKIIILLTDGVNNAGKISPLTAAEAARALGVKVYTIGAGTKDVVPYPVQDVFGGLAYQYVKIEIDEDTLAKIATLTGAKYFRATDTPSLKNIYQEINRLEKTKIEEKGYRQYRELFVLFLIPALILVLLEMILVNTVLRKIP